MKAILIISDSLGYSASAIAEAAVSQFEVKELPFLRLANTLTLEQVEHFVSTQLETYQAAELIAFFTIANPDLIREIKQHLLSRHIAYVDVLGPALNAIASKTGLMPLARPGLMHRTDEEYYNRVEAMEFAVDHDDGRRAEDLPKADLVLIGSSRTSKTPLSVFLATLGYKVANVPLAPGVEPPRELFWVERWRLYGLSSQPGLLASIRERRLGNAREVAASYANIDYVAEDLKESRALMRQLGCIVVRTDNRAVEETAAEILRYYKAAQATQENTR